MAQGRDCGQVSRTRPRSSARLSASRASDIDSVGQQCHEPVTHMAVMGDAIEVVYHDKALAVEPFADADQSTRHPPVWCLSSRPLLDCNPPSPIFLLKLRPRCTGRCAAWRFDEVEGRIRNARKGEFGQGGIHLAPPTTTGCGDGAAAPPYVLV